MLTFIETRLFTRLVREWLGDDEYAALQWTLATNPFAGDLIRGSGGVRKVRWSAGSRGKSGGVRVIYYARTHRGEIWMLTINAKNVVESMSANVLRQIRDEIDG